MVFELKGNKKYSWKSGFNRSVDANIAGSVIEQIQERDGCVTKTSFLEASRPEDSPTHSLFEWNDSVAGEKWREYQSMQVINSIEVTITTPEQTEKKTRAFVLVDKQHDCTKKARLVSVGVAMADVQMRSQVLENALMELTSFKRKYENLNELSGVFEAIDRAVEEYKEDD